MEYRAGRGMAGISHAVKPCINSPATVANIRVPHSQAPPRNLASAQKPEKTAKKVEKSLAKLSVGAILNDVLRPVTDCLRSGRVTGLIKKVRKIFEKRFEKIADDDILRTRCPPKRARLIEN